MDIYKKSIVQINVSKTLNYYVHQCMHFIKKEN